MNRKLNIILSIITAFAFTTNAITVTDNSSKTGIETAIQNAADGETIYFDFDGDEGFEVILGGDCELETTIRALKFITKVLEDQAKEVYD